MKSTRTCVQAVNRLVVCSLAVLTVLVLALGASIAQAQKAEVDVAVADAIVAYGEKRYADALKLLQDALKADPTDLQALYNTGLVYLALEQPGQAVEVLEKARAQAPTDHAVLFQLGVAYFQGEQYDKAQPLLTEVFTSQPGLENLGYYVGFMRYRDKDYQGALRAFTAGRTTDPRLQQLTRYYSGLALGILGLPERAASEVEEGLRILPASPVTGPAERLRDSLSAARERERRLHAELRFGGFYDDNVAINPRPSSEPFAENTLRPRKTHSPGELAAARVDYAWLRTGPWESSVNYSFLQTLNNALPSFNIQDHLGGVGGTYRGVLNALPYQVGVNYTYDFLTLGEAAFLQRHTGSLYGTLVEDARNLTSALVRIQAKDFLNDAATIGPLPVENRDAKNYLGGLLHVFRFEADKHLLRVGYQFDREVASGANYTYSGHRPTVGGQYTLPWGLPWGALRFRYDGELHFRHYSNLNTLFPQAAQGTVQRTDREQIHTVRLEQPLMDGFTLSAEYIRDDNWSNLAVFNYVRNTTYLILSWRY